MSDLVLLPSGPWLEDEFGCRAGGIIVWKSEKALRVFGTPSDPQSELWDGPAEGPRLAERLGAQFVSALEFDRVFNDEWALHGRVVFPWGEAVFAARLMALMSSRKRFTRAQTMSVDWRVYRGPTRLVKTEDELVDFRASVALSAAEHRRLMERPWEGRSELEIARDFRAGHLLAGTDELAYDSIVAAGERACVLHARATDRILKDGELVLIDAGGRGRGWCADITRTWPVGRGFTEQQRAVYEVVLGAQKKAIDRVRPGLTLEEIHESAREDLREGLRLRGYRDEADAIEQVFPHRTSHWLGRRVHDHCPYHDEGGRPLRLEPGMVLTIEPGLYFREGPLKGIGVRIEDDVLVTAQGREVLSAAAPKEIEEIEALRARSVSR